MTGVQTCALPISVTFLGNIRGVSLTASQDNGTDVVVGGNRINSWRITGTNNTGTVTGLSGTFSSIERLVGNSQRDVFTLHNTIDFKIGRASCRERV